MSAHIVAIDQGTTSTRAIVFDAAHRIAGVAQQEFAQHFPRPGWVEHDPEDLWRTSVETVRQALASAGVSAGDVAALGITNQRETTLVWNRKTGEPIHRAIVWQDRRTAELCARLVREGHEAALTASTGLVVDPYFSATKVAWLLENVEGARAAAEAGELAFGTVDSWLIWKLTGGRRHVTDATNACRTLLFNIHTHEWDEDILALLGIPAKILPEVLDCDAEFGTTERALFSAEIPILGVAGDQQAATLGQACFSPGMLKSTYGTGCFALLNTGAEPVASRNRLLTTIAYRLGGETTYALEGAIFVAGAAVQWLRDGLGLLKRADETERMAAESDPEQAVYLVPAFVGLGTPHWDPDARGAIFGLTRATGPNELARAALESVCFQTADLADAMHEDWSGSGVSPAGAETVLRVDGGMVVNDWAMQRLADLLAAPVDRPVIGETTALGAAWLAGQKSGVWPDREGFAKAWRLDRRFEPSMDEEVRRMKLAGWRDAVKRTLSRR
jgi:glycerol kinase